MRDRVHTNTNKWHVSRSQRSTFRVSSRILPHADRVSLVSVIVSHTLLRVGSLLGNGSKAVTLYHSSPSC